MAVSHVCRCVSMKPGMTTLPVASISFASALMSGRDLGDGVALDQDVGLGQVTDVGIHRDHGATTEQQTICHRAFLPVVRTPENTPARNDP